ncbi:MAG: hypothetical protein U0800_10660 [Isosphaeraceae bacterium]
MKTTPGRTENGQNRRDLSGRNRFGMAALILAVLSGWASQAEACHSTTTSTTKTATVKARARHTVKTTTVTPAQTPTTTTTTVTTPVIPRTTTPIPLPEVIRPTGPVVTPSVSVTPTTTCCSCSCPTTPTTPAVPGTVRPQVQTPEPSTAVIGLGLIAAGTLLQRRFRRARTA